jgi:phosphatidylglycerol:prolipoprotein diacylglycerol transferase
MQFRVHYSLFMILALAVFLLVRHYIPRPHALTALPWWKRCLLALAAFVGGAFGAKLPFVLGVGADVSEGPSWLRDAPAWLRECSALFRDGKTITTGLIGAYLGVEIAKLLLDVRVKTGDSFALPLALALAVGRWGCFFHGCCHGVETDLPWAAWFLLSTPDGPRWALCHPTQVYESLFHLTMAGVLLLLLRLDVLRCQHLKLYLIAYGVYRFLTEYIRPEPPGLLGLTFYQWVSVVLVVGLSGQWFVDRRCGLAEAEAPCPAGAPAG